MIKVENISKSYGEKNQKILAVDDISFSVEKGEIFGLIGPDGSGKTSIFRMLTTVLLSDSGNAKIDGLDVINNYKKIRIYTKNHTNQRRKSQLGLRIKNSCKKRWFLENRNVRRSETLIVNSEFASQ